MKLAIGTAQLGMKYGLFNKSRKIDFLEFKKILNLAIKNNIKIIDTAASYGDSEKKIGKYLINRRNRFKIITKLPSCRKISLKHLQDRITNKIINSTKKLKTKKL